MLHRKHLRRPLALACGLALVASACGDDGGGDGEEAGSDTLCGGTEFIDREDGMLGLQDVYEFEFPDVQEISDELVYNEVAEGNCLFASVFRTDGRIPEFDLVVLEDDLEFFPPYNAALTVREEVYDEYPDELEELFGPVATALDEDTMVELNGQVVTGGEDPEDVASGWLEDNDLVGSGETPLEGASFTVGSKEFTEQLVLGQITVAVLEDAGASVSYEDLVGTDVVRASLEGGDIDMYWEYLGTGWVDNLGNGEAVSSDPQEQLEALQGEDEGIVWLDAFTPFNDTYGIAMTQEKSDELGITTISDAADYLEE